MKNRGLYQWYSVYDLYGVWLRGGGSAINGKPNTNDPTQAVCRMPTVCFVSSANVSGKLS